jgi:lysophospholipase L1-like esterase
LPVRQINPLEEHAMTLPFQAWFDAVRHAAASLARATAALDRQRRVLLLTGAVVAAALAFAPPAASAQPGVAEHWVGTWGAGMGGPPPRGYTMMFTNQTLRLVVRTSIGGNRVRIRLSNEMGSTPLTIGEAHIAVRATGAAIATGSDRALAFGGRGPVTIPPGATALSDPVELNVPALSDLAISLYLPESTAATTIHNMGSQTSFVSLPGNFTGAPSLPLANTIQSWPFLAEVDVDSSGAAIVAFGDSITDGNRSTPNTNNRWPDWLAQRLLAERDAGPGIGRLGVVNRGISGNRLLADPPQGSLAGKNGLERFERDVLGAAGARYMMVMLGMNDIGYSASANPIGADVVIAGLRRLAARAREKGIAVYGATLTPFEGAGYYSPQKEAVRQAVNDWIRGNDVFDGVIDFDAALRDPAQSSRLLPAYDSGDHLHPNDLGYQAMGYAVPLGLFQPKTAGKMKQVAGR